MSKTTIIILMILAVIVCIGVIIDNLPDANTSQVSANISDTISEPVNVQTVAEEKPLDPEQTTVPTLQASQISRTATDLTPVPTLESVSTYTPAPTEQASPSDTSDTIVYITKTGTKYHNESCSYLSSSKIAITLEEAKSKGYTPCSRCNPPI